MTNKERALLGFLPGSNKLKAGQTIAGLTVLHYIENRKSAGSNHSKAWFRARCACGNVIEVNGSDLSTRTGFGCSACRYDQKRKTKIGDRFDKLVVTGIEATLHRGQVRCLCDCGNIISLRALSLRKNKTNNCGCDVRGLWVGVGNLSRHRIKRLIRGAESRGISVDVTVEQLWELYVAQRGLCALSGIPIPIDKKSKNYVASVDRIDSALPYVISNVQWVHKEINVMKMALPEDRFVELCRLVADHHSRNKRSAAA